MLKPDARPAKLQYLANNFRVLVDGDYVTCAVSQARIPLDDLKYWNAPRQEAYATAEAATEALAPK